MNKVRGGLYVITDKRLISRGNFLGDVRKSLLGGASIIQLREKGTPAGEIVSLGREILKLTADTGVPLIINDSPELAKEIGAQGVHLGEDDPSIEDARLVLGEDAIIGVSCYNRLERGVDAEARGADYVVFGTPYPTPTKPGREPTPLEILIKAKEIIRSVPVFAIGGINVENAPEILRTGVDGIAVITSVFGASDPGKATRELVEIIEKYA